VSRNFPSSATVHVAVFFLFYFSKRKEHKNKKIKRVKKDNTAREPREIADRA